MSEQFKSKRLTVRALSLNEMQQLQNSAQNFLKESVLSEVIRNAITKKIERMREVSEDAHPWLTYWLIREEDSGQGIGLVGSKFLPDEEGYVELGYAIAEENRRNGYMTEALEGFLDWLCEFPFCNGAVLSIWNENASSIKVAEKCGFCYKETKEGYRIYQYDF